MQNKYSQWFVWGVVGLLIIGIVAALIANKNKLQSEVSDQKRENQQNSSAKVDPMTNNDMLSGMLRKSDNLNRGSLMLVMPDHVVYLTTSRDFSSLVDQAVNVEIDGDFNNFRLLDITAK